MRSLLSPSHGHSSPEKRFSINNNILLVHCSSLGENYITTLCIAKHKINRDRGVLKVSVSQNLILSVKHLHVKYQADLEEKIRLAEQEVACKTQLEADEQEQNEMKSMQRSI